MAPVIVLAVGNPSRGDDALGPLLCGRLEKWLEIRGLTSQIELVEDFQLNVEHALDLVGRQLALFVDARQGMVAPVNLQPVVPAATRVYTTHALTPAGVLAAYGQAIGGTPPPAYELGVAGEAFELGAPLSARAAGALEQALVLLRDLCENPSPAVWAQRAAGLAAVSDTPAPGLCCG